MSKTVPENQKKVKRKIKNQKVSAKKSELKEKFYVEVLKDVRKQGLNKSVTKKIPWNKKRFTPSEKGIITKLYKESLLHKFENFVPIKKGRKESAKAYRKRVAIIKKTYGQAGHMTKGVFISIPKEIAAGSKFKGINFITPEIKTASGITREIHIPVDKEFIVKLFVHIEKLNELEIPCDFYEEHPGIELLYDKLEDYIVNTWIENKKPNRMHILYGTGKSGRGYEFTEETYFDDSYAMANDILKTACNYEEKISTSAKLFNGFIGIFEIKNNRKKKRKK